MLNYVPTVPTLFRPKNVRSERLTAAPNISIIIGVPTVPTFLLYTHAHMHTHVCVSVLGRNSGTKRSNHKQIKSLWCSDLTKIGRNKVGTVGTCSKEEVK